MKQDQLLEMADMALYQTYTDIERIGLRAITDYERKVVSDAKACHAKLVRYLETARNAPPIRAEYEVVEEAPGRAPEPESRGSWLGSVFGFVFCATFFVYLCKWLLGG